MEDFVPFEIAKKLKEKGFHCKYPIAMYNENGMFCPLYTSADHNEDIKCMFGNREYYDYDDFDSRDFIAPTIAQVLKWLREHNIYIVVFINDDTDNPVTYEIYKGIECVMYEHKYYSLSEWNNAEIDAIEYALDRLM